jgi:L-fucose isomerase-like protein
MPNQDLMNKNIVVNSQHKKILGDKISGNNMTTLKSRLENKDNISDEEQSALDWLTKKYDEEVKRIDSVKRTQMKTGRENTFKKTHTKDKNNKNVDKIGGLAKLTASGEHSKVSDQIENNRVQYYESLDVELDKIKYLIEYFDNNNNNKNK